MGPLALGVDVGNAKIKLCLGRAGEAPRWLSRPLPYDASAPYARARDFERGVPAALDELFRASGSSVRSARPEVAVAVTSAGYSYPSFDACTSHLARVLREALPETRVAMLSGTLELVPAEACEGGEPALLGPIAFSNPNGAAVLACRLGLFGEGGAGLVLDTGGQTTGVVVLEPGGVVDRAALAAPSRHIEHRVAHGKLAWVGLETTPLEALASEVVVELERGPTPLPVVPRGVPFSVVAALLGLGDAARAKKLALFGLAPTRAHALRALADAVGLDRELVSERALVALAEAFYERAIDRLARELGRALASAPPSCRARAALFGLGAEHLARPALARAGVPEAGLVMGHTHLGHELAEAASCVGAWHAALEEAHGRALTPYAPSPGSARA